jgi:hypothetical protein
MSFKSSKVTVGTSATPLTPISAPDGSPGRSLIVRNTSGAEIRTGGSGVTWANGMPLLDGETKTYQDLDFQTPYAIAQVNADVNVEQEGV